MQWRERLRQRFSPNRGATPAAWTEDGDVRTGREAVAETERRTGAVRADDLGEAIGRAMAGARVWTVLRPGARDTERLAQAVERHVPLVAHAFDGGAALEALSGTGALLLAARSAQEAADLTILARRVAERALVPAVVVQDAEATADSIRNLRLHAAPGIRAFLGNPDDGIESGTPAQEMLFGRNRRRIPLWFDGTHPALHGATLDAAARGAMRAAQGPFFQDALDAILADEIAAVVSRTGRPLDAVSSFETKDADLVLVAAGATVDVAETVAATLRIAEKRKVGVLGVRAVRPFPAAALAAQLGRAKTVAVLEPVLLPHGAEGALARGVRAALDESEPRDGRAFVTAVCGASGLPLRAADLAEFCRADEPSTRILGVDFLPPATIDPKRQVLLDELRRAYPGIASLGLRCVRPFAFVAGGSPLVVGLHVPRGDAAYATLVREAAGTLFRAADAPVASRPEGPGRTRLVVGRHMPGADAPLDVALVVLPARSVEDGDAEHPLDASLEALGEGGTLIVTGARDVERVLARMPFPLQRTVRQKSLRLRSLRIGGAGSAEETIERLLGALCEAAAPRLDGVDADRCLAARTDALATLDDAARATRLAAFTFGQTHVASPDPDKVFEPTAATPGAVEPETPAAARALGRTDDRWDSLPRFWDQTGVLYREGRVAQLSPDPYLALASMPPLSSSFRKRPLDYATFPEFEPARCTGCGDCWTTCPDGAIQPRPIAARALLEHGLARATEQGANVSALRPMLSKIAPAIDAALDGDDSARTFGDAARAAFESVMDATKTAEDKRRGLADAMAAVLETVGVLPVARTAPFHGDGGGELLALAIDPNTCQGCAACVAACEADALSAQPITRSRTAAGKRVAAVAAALPEPSAETVARAAANGHVGPAAAALLGGAPRAAMVGGSAAEPGSGAQLALRLTLAGVETGCASRRAAHRTALDELRGRFADEVRKGLLKSVPTDDLDAISDGLKVLGRRDLDVGQLIGRLEEATGSEHVDGARLGRLVDAATDVANLIHRQDRAAQGAYGIVLGGEGVARWAAAFPHNPFSAPVVVDPGDEALSLALGLSRAAVADTIAAARDRRHAEHVLQHAHPGIPVELPGSWSDLTDEERLLCPPLVVALDGAAWGRARLADVNAALAGDAPLLLVVLSATIDEARATAALSPATGTRIASTIVHADHLVDAVSAAVTAGGPAWIHVLAPDPSAAKLPADGARAEARRRVEEGAFRLRPAEATALAAAADADDGDTAPAAALEDAARSADAAARKEMSRRLTERLMQLAGYEPRGENE